MNKSNFEKLQTWLKKYAGYSLGPRSVRRDFYSGTGHRINTTFSTLLGDDQGRCLRCLDELRSARKNGDKVLVKRLKGKCTAGDPVRPDNPGDQMQFGFEDYFLEVRIFGIGNREKRIIYVSVS